jgi:hypothetical protein
MAAYKRGAGLLIFASLIAGCGGSASLGPTATERAICETVEAYVAASSTTTTTTLPPNFVGGVVGVHGSVAGVPTAFVAQLAQSKNPVFESIARQIQEGNGQHFLSQLNKECSSIGL